MSIRGSYRHMEGAESSALGLCYNARGFLNRSFQKSPSMSIYTKIIDNLTSADLQELLDEHAVENIRLEFKLERPGKDETLKKLSSFANTYGGYLIIGTKARSADGVLIELPGIDQARGFKQQIVQWCYDGASPPIEVFVSPPIPAPSDSTEICYVIYVPESEEAPHFLNSRKGVYIRTDEFGSIR